MDGSLKLHKEYVHFFSSEYEGNSDSEIMTTGVTSNAAKKQRLVKREAAPG